MFASYLHRTQQYFHTHRRFAVRMVSFVVGVNGLFIVIESLLDQIAAHHDTRLNDIAVDLPLLIGFSLIYLSTLLLRRKQTAWFVSILAYVFYFGNSLATLIDIDDLHHHIHSQFIIRLFLLPLAVVILLYVFRHEFVVRSDVQGFRGAARFSVIVLLIAFLYGVGGFQLLDKSDFHQEITLTSAVHYTLDQFDLTTQPLHAYTRRAQLFSDSLSFVSVAAFGYAALALFQPLRSRLGDQSKSREAMRALLESSNANSEDYFKLWPHDKQYYFANDQRAGLAFHVRRGVAIVLGDPVGKAGTLSKLIDDFSDLCFSNDWLPAFVHIQEKHRKLYEKHDFTLQRLGQEAVIDIAHFQAEVARNKYFRHINNKFTKQGYLVELLTPPHHQAVIDRLQIVSEEWLARGGHVERGFAMGYFSEAYMQQCPVFVVRDAAGTIRAFLNQLPATFDRKEATYDLLRHTNDSPGNINDFLMVGVIAQLQVDGYQYLNLGLCPLTGLQESDIDSNGLIDGVLRLAYANGDRFYSFSGLYRFKAKYEPEWRDRYVAYRSGVRGFTRSMTALMLTMRLK